VVEHGDSSIPGLTPGVVEGEGSERDLTVTPRVDKGFAERIDFRLASSKFDIEIR